LRIEEKDCFAALAIAALCVDSGVAFTQSVCGTEDILAIAEPFRHIRKSF